MRIEGYLTVVEVAARLATSGTNVRRWCTEGRFPGARKVGSAQRGTWLIPMTALEGFVKPKRGPKTERTA